MDNGLDARTEISMIKFFGARILHDVLDRAIQVHGALGFSQDSPLENWYREARAARIYDGPDEVHRMVVARQILRSFAMSEARRQKSDSVESNAAWPTHTLGREAI
jgi:alkylation response protein AidB-like acyl-CoA dehydrogenase